MKKFVKLLNWKFGVILFVIIWSLGNIFPVQSTPFEDYLRQEVSAEQEEFFALIDKAKEKESARRVESRESLTGQESSLFVALETLLAEDRDALGEKYDLHKYFPHLNTDIWRNIDKRNKVLLNHLLEESRGKVKLGLDLNGGVGITFQLKEGELSKDPVIRDSEIEKAISIISKRVDAFGVGEPVVRLKNTAGIEVQIPGLSIRDNPDIPGIISAPAKLEFSEVHRTLQPADMNERPPPGYKTLVETVEDGDGTVTELPVFVKRVPHMGGEIIEEAQVRIDSYGRPFVSMEFTSEGSEIFTRVTKEMVDENERTETVGRLAIILDGKLISSPTVKNAIYGGSAIIEGKFTQPEAIELCNALNNPLKFGLATAEIFEVGPSLAETSRDQSIRAGILGVTLVVLFMLGYYYFAGFIAVLTLAINLLIVVGTFCSIGGAFSLPGVAALVLTIGMAVDAQILIYERIREELREGKKLKAAISGGFSKAYSTIIDANITTFLTALILLTLGAGAVKGFGVMLAIGIGSSMFCALFVSRCLLEPFGRWPFLKNRSLFYNTKNNYMRRKDFSFFSWRRVAFISSWVLVLFGACTVFFKFDTLFGPGFRGGDELTVQYQKVVSVAEVEESAVACGIDFVHANTLRLTGSEHSLLKIQTNFGDGSKLFEQLLEKYPERGLELVGIEKIGASVSKEVKWSALISVVTALFGMLLYVAFRFETGYGIGAIVATVHDVAMTIALYVVFGGQFTAPMVAAILMIVGYSINDTIVVFDRVREALGMDPKTSLEGIINRAINLTLARTLLTSVTTLLATLSLYIFGTGVVVDFALVFIIGILTGTFSSIFIACPVFYWFKSLKV